MKSQAFLLSVLLAVMDKGLAKPFNAETGPAGTLQARDFVNVAYGEQLQSDTQTNSWVAWIEGKSACPAAQVLVPLTESPCGHPFTLGGDTFQLGDCDGMEPKSLLDSGGGRIRGCSSSRDKINCHHGKHDIVKHGKCNA